MYDNRDTPGRPFSCTDAGGARKTAATSHAGTKRVHGPDITKYRGPERVPGDRQDVDDPLATDCNAYYENDYHEQGRIAREKGMPHKSPNITQVAEERRNYTPAEYNRREENKRPRSR